MTGTADLYTAVTRRNALIALGFMYDLGYLRNRIWDDEYTSILPLRPAKLLEYRSAARLPVSTAGA